MLRRWFSYQARNPSGLFGRFVAPRIFDKGNARLNTRMVQLVNATGDMRILEIGFGTGSTVRSMADSLSGGCVEGIDISDEMMRIACKRNREHMTSGRVRFTHGDFTSTAYPESSFDAVCSANTIYFWRDVPASLACIHAMLRPGARVVLAFVGREKMQDMPLDFEVFSPVSATEVEALLAKAGFSHAGTHASQDFPHEYCVVGTK